MKSEAEGYEAWSDLHLHVEFYLLTFQVDLLALKTIFQNSFCKRIFSVFSASSPPFYPSTIFSYIFQIIQRGQ